MRLNSLNDDIISHFWANYPFKMAHNTVVTECQNDLIPFHDIWREESFVRLPWSLLPQITSAQLFWTPDPKTPKIASLLKWSHKELRS